MAIKDSNLITSTYQQYLGRAPTAAEVAWQQANGNQNTFVNTVMNSPEARSRSTTSTPAPAAPVQAAPVSAPDTVKPLVDELTTFDQNAKNPLDIYNAALEKLGVSDARTRVTSLRQALINNQNLLDALPGDISGRTQNSLVTENQRRRLLSMESEPIVGMGNKINQEFGAAQGDYSQVLNEGKTTADLEMSGQTARRTALLDRLKIQIDATNDAEKKRQWQAEYDRQIAQDKQNQANSDREFSLAQQTAKKSGGSSGGGSTKLTAAQQKVETIKSLDSDISANITDFRKQPKFWTEKTLIPQLIAAYPELSKAEITARVYALRKQYE